MLAKLLFVALATFAAAMPAPEADPDPAPSAATVSPNPSQVYINSIAYGGTGCPQGSIGSYISADRQTFVVPSKT